MRPLAREVMSNHAPRIDNSYSRLVKSHFRTEGNCERSTLDQACAKQEHLKCDEKRFLKNSGDGHFPNLGLHSQLSSTARHAKPRHYRSNLSQHLQQPSSLACRPGMHPTSFQASETVEDNCSTINSNRTKRESIVDAGIGCIPNDPGPKITIKKTYRL